MRAGLLGLAIVVALLAAGQARPGPGTSASGRFRVTLVPEVEPIPLGTWHRWRLHIERTDGAPPVLERLGVDGGMPAHGHGLPSRPQVERAATAGDYLVHGVRFSMAGRWELRVFLGDREGNDTAVVRFDVGAAVEAGAARWSEAERRALRTFQIDRLGPPPADPTNRVADDPRAVALGHRLFFARELSGDGKTSCATCHDPARSFADGRRVGHGVADLARNTPSLVGVGHARALYWDGRRDSLWSQALAPIEAPLEMQGSRVAALHFVARKHRAAYEAIFNALPDLSGLPAAASPVGDARARAAWAQIPRARQEAITRAFTNLGKSIAAYERRLAAGRSSFDRYVDALVAGDDTAAAKILSPAAVAGLRFFLSAGAQCTRCHNGPLFTNGDFHNIGTGTSGAEHPDLGRSIGIQAVLSTEFNCLGPYSDNPTHRCPELDYLNRHEENATLVGAYKVPGLRNVAATAPYMHDGRFASLAEVVEHYRRPRSAPSTMELRPLHDLTAARAAALVAFLESLSAPVDAPPELLQPPAR